MPEFDIDHDAEVGGHGVAADTAVPDGRSAGGHTFSPRLEPYGLLAAICDAQLLPLAVHTAEGMRPLQGTG